MNDKSKPPSSDPINSNPNRWDYVLTALFILLYNGFVNLDADGLVKQAEKNRNLSGITSTTDNARRLPFCSVLQQSTKPPAEFVDLKNHPHVADSGAITVFGHLLVKYAGMNVNDVIVYTQYSAQVFWLYL